MFGRGCESFFHSGKLHYDHRFTVIACGVIVQLLEGNEKQSEAWSQAILMYFRPQTYVSSVSVKVTHGRNTWKSEGCHSCRRRAVSVGIPKGSLNRLRILICASVSVECKHKQLGCLSGFTVGESQTILAHVFSVTNGSPTEALSEVFDNSLVSSIRLI